MNISYTRKRFSYRWVILFAGLAITLFVFGMRNSYGVFFESLQRDFAMTRAETGGIFSVLCLFWAIAAFIAGWATDRFGPRVVATSGGILVGLGLALSSQVSASWQLYLTWGLILGLGFVIAWIPVNITLPRWFTRRKGLALGIASSGVGIGMLMLPPVSGYLVSTYDWRATHIILAIAIGAIIFICGQLLREAPQEKAVLDYHEAANRDESAEKVRITSLGLTLKQALRTRSLWLILLVYFCYATTVSMTVTHLVRHAIDLGVKLVVASTFLSAIGGAGILGSLFSGGASDKIGRKLTLSICFGLMSASMFWLTQTEAIWAFFIFSAFFGISYGGVVPVIPILMSESIGLRSFGSAYGLALTFAGIGGIVGPLLAGHFFDISGSYLTSFLLAGSVSLVSAIMIPFMKVETEGRPYQSGD